MMLRQARWLLTVIVMSLVMDIFLNIPDNTARAQDDTGDILPVSDRPLKEMTLAKDVVFRLIRSLDASDDPEQIQAIMQGVAGWIPDLLIDPGMNDTGIWEAASLVGPMGGSLHAGSVNSFAYEAIDRLRPDWHDDARLRYYMSYLEMSDAKLSLARIRSEREQLLPIYDRARSGDVESAYELGEAYLHERGVVHNEKEAAKWLATAVQGGNTSAMYDLGGMYQSGEGVAKDDEKALSLFQKAALLGNVSAMDTLAWKYRYGSGVEKDEALAKKWQEKALAAYRAGVKFDLPSEAKGNGKARQDEIAIADLRVLIADGDSDAMVRLGVRYAEGRGLEKDVMQGLSLFMKGAEGGNATAMTDLGIAYQNGCGAELNDATAASWYLKAAEAGDVHGMSILGGLYGAGRGVEKDTDKMIGWYQQAADGGDAISMFWLGQIYELGKGVVKNDEQALEWYKKAAQHGDGMAMFYIARILDGGRSGTPEDPKALNWYRRAAQAGNEPAQDYLRAYNICW